MLRAPTGSSKAVRGDDKMAKIPRARARGVNEDHLVSVSNDSAWNHRPRREASTQGPSPVAYWSASISMIVLSVAATVRSSPWRNNETLTPSAPLTDIWASSTTRRSAPSTTSGSVGIAVTLLRSSHEAFEVVGLGRWLD